MSLSSNKKITDLTKKNGVNQNVQATDYKPISPAVSRGEQRRSTKYALKTQMKGMITKKRNAIQKLQNQPTPGKQFEFDTTISVYTEQLPGKSE